MCYRSLAAYSAASAAGSRERLEANEVGTSGHELNGGGGGGVEDAGTHSPNVGIAAGNPGDFIGHWVPRQSSEARLQA